MSEETPTTIQLNPGESWQALSDHMASNPDQYHDAIKPIIEDLVQQHTAAPGPSTDQAVQALRTLPLERAANEAADAFSHANAKADPFMNQTRSKLLTEVSKFAPQVTDEVFTIISKITDRYERGRAAEAVVPVAVAMGRVDECLGWFTDKDSGDYQRNTILAHVATELSHTGRSDEAITQARRITSVYFRTQKLIHILDDHPEKAPEIYNAVLDTSNDQSSESEGEVGRSRISALASLAEYLPEAAKTAVDKIGKGAKGDEGSIDDLLKLSKYEPSMALKAVEIFSGSRDRERQYLGEYERKRLDHQQAEFKNAALMLADQGHHTEAITAAGVSGYRVREEITPELAAAAVRAGQFEQAVTIVEGCKGYNGVALAKNILPDIQDLQLRHQVIDHIRSQGRLSDLSAIAADNPELIPEVEAGLENKSNYFDANDAKKDLVIAYLAVDRKEDALNILRSQSYYEKLGAIDRMILPANLDVAMEITSTMLDDSNRALALAKLLPFSPEAITEVVRIVEQVLAPSLTIDYENDDRSGPTHAGKIVGITDLLAESGYIDEAARISNVLRGRAYITAVSAFVDQRSDMLPDFVAAVGTLQTSERVGKELASVLDKLSTEQIDGLVGKLSEMENNGLRLIAANSIADKLIATGQSEALLNLLPDQLLYGSDKNFFKQIASELAQQGDLAALRAIAARMGTKHYDQRDFLGDMLDQAPELASDLWSILKQHIDASEHDPFIMRDAIKIAQYIPEAADYVMSSLDNPQQKNQLGLDFNKEAGIAKVVALIDAGRAAEILQLVGRHLGELTLVERILPKLVEHGDITLAFEIARGVRDSTTRARALMCVVPKERDAGQKPLLTELLGEAGVSGGLHEISDRSINARFFTSEIAKEPLLIEAFMGRATSPAELLAIMKTVDAAAELTDNGNELRYQALKFLQRFDTTKIMSDYWKEERQQQALGGERADHERFRDLPNLRQLTANLKSNTAELAKELLKNGYSAADLFEHPWLLTADIGEMAKTGNLFPASSSKAQQHMWLADNAFVALQGFSRRQIGQILDNRLSNNMEYSLHDASQWLQAFQVKAQESVYNPESGSLETEQLRSFNLQQKLLTALVDRAYSPEELRRLPGFMSAGGEITELKTQKFDQLFDAPRYAVVYAAILQELAASPAGKIEDIASLQNRIEQWAESGLIDAWAGQSKEIIPSKIDTLSAQARNVFEGVLDKGAPRPDYSQEELKVTYLIGQLSAIGKARKEHIDATTTWLKTYQNLPAQKLERVWAERQDALAAGVPDHPNDIYEWSLSSSIRSHLSRMSDENGMLEGGIPATDLVTRFRAFVPELVTRYDSDRTVTALTKLWETHTSEADLTPLSVELADGYTFKVFSKDDPAGMTIGFDTDCCMTIGGASQSCIYTGYSDPRFGFVGLYDQDQKLVAQSFVWHNQGTLVLDNIEGQRGRNLSDIQDRYREALTEYLVKLNQEKPELGIKSVNLGTGYLNSQLMRGLQQVESVPLPKVRDYLYTDARDQVRLLSISDAELAQRVESPPSEDIDITPTAIEPQLQREARPEMVAISSAVADADTISEIEAQVYPSELSLGRADIRADLERPNNYSFLIGTRNGNGGTVGYLIAYHDDDADAVYVSDLALLPSEQRSGYGAAAMDYLLERVAEAGEHRVIFEARESTSYQALQSPSAALILAKHGYSIARSQRKEGYFDNGEDAYEVILEMEPVMAGVGN